MVRDYLIGVTRHEDDSCGWRLRGNLFGEIHALTIGITTSVRTRSMAVRSCRHLHSAFGAITCLDHVIARERERLKPASAEAAPRPRPTISSRSPFNKWPFSCCTGFAVFACDESREVNGKLRALAWFASHRDGSLILAGISATVAIPRPVPCH